MDMEDVKSTVDTENQITMKSSLEIWREIGMKGYMKLVNSPVIYR